MDDDNKINWSLVTHSSLSRSYDWINKIGPTIIKSVECWMPVTKYYCKLCGHHIGHYKPKSFFCEEEACKSEEVISTTETEMIDKQNTEWISIWNELAKS